MRVPNSSAFYLTDIKAAIQDHSPVTVNDLNACFANSIPAYFDPLYNTNSYAIPNSMLRFRNYGPNTPVIPTCPNRRVVIQICNDNSIIDDNFNIYLNNNYIGAVNLNQNAQIGSLFIADLNNVITVTSSDFVCSLSNMITYRFNPSFLLPSNTLEMRNSKANNHGNQGTIGIRNYLLSGNYLSSPCVITNLSFNGSTGESFTFNFTYTECCP